MEAIDLEWTPLRGASAYRLTVTDSDTAERLVRTEALTVPRYALDASLAESRAIEAKLEYRSGEAADHPWKEAGPTVRIPVPDPRDDVTVLRWEGRSPIHRLVVADQTAARTVFDRPVLGSSYPYAPSPGERGHDLVMRVHAWVDGDWDEGTAWRPLPLRILLGERRQPPSPLQTESVPPLLLAFTIDTEGFMARQRDPNPATAVDELIFGDYGNFEHHGIGLHMDLLEHFGFRGCFFVDVLSEYQYGQDALQRTVDAVLERGHEVQLHVHDEHLRNSDDPGIRALAGDMLHMDADAFRRVLELGVSSYERLTGEPPLAYRAGGYRIRDEHFPVLEEFGIRIDSSVQSYFHAHVAEWMRTRTQPFWIGDMLEVPPTWTLVRDDRDAPETRSLAPNATAGDPVSRMPSSDGDVPRLAMYVSHSCELMKVERDLSPEAVAAYERTIRGRVRPEVADRVVQEVEANARLIDGRLDPELLYRVAGLLRRIADRDDARVVTMAELHEIAGRFPRERTEPVDPVPVIDRPHGAATVTGTRVYSRELLEHLRSSGAGNGAPPGFRDDAVSTLVNADVSWDGKAVAVIGDEADAVIPWLERRGVSAVERLVGPETERTDGFDVVVWLSGFERCAPAQLRDRLDAAVGMLRDEGALVVRVRTLGVTPDAARNGQPPLADLVFPAAALASGEVTAWDAGTFSAWFAARGLRVAAERAISRSGVELAALDHHRDKLAAIPDQELRTGSVDFTLRRDVPAEEKPADQSADAATPAPPQPLPGLPERFEAISPGDDVLEITAADGVVPDPGDLEDVTVGTASVQALADGALERAGSDVIVCDALGEVELERLQDACNALYEALRPGGQLLLRLRSGDEGPATPTAMIVGLLRAGFEVVGSEDSGPVRDLRLLRPLELADIAAFSGLS
jgi:hypothetical protein